MDDVLERVVNSGRGIWNPRVYPVRWPSDTHSPPAKDAIGIYHLHGFVPQDPKRYPFRFPDSGIADAPVPVESLVFTDAQYWRAMGNPGDFASRVFAQALGGRCVFIGLSMTDINIMRCLANYAMETRQDIQTVTANWTQDSYVAQTEFEELSAHFWIREKEQGSSRDMNPDFGTQVLKSVLEDSRGVRFVEVPSWVSSEFVDWWRECFVR